MANSICNCRDFNMITIPGKPVAKPRMTRRDKWMGRKPVVQYWEWVNMATRIVKEQLDQDPLRVIITAYFGFPKSYSKQKRELLEGQLHRLLPDGDNVLKAVVDALWKKNDQRIAIKTIIKRWDDGKGPRVEVQTP